MINFQVGQQVVCVDDSNLKIDQGKYLKNGQIYTIRWIGPAYIPNQAGNGFEEEICVRLVGITRPIMARRMKEKFGMKGGSLVTSLINGHLDSQGYNSDEFDDMPFRAVRFRPLDEKKDKLEIFNKLLTPIPEKV